MDLLSYRLFGHCSIEHESPSIELTDLTETFEVTVTGVNPSTGLALIDNGCIDVGGSPFGEPIEVSVSDALGTGCPSMDITDVCSGFTVDSSIEHDSSRSGFMLIHDNFVTSDDDHGACSWSGDTDIALNADF